MSRIVAIVIGCILITKNITQIIGWIFNKWLDDLFAN
jgi:hypothetical protein